jgi:hypothetical protein
MSRVLIRLYPAKWQERYGVEFEAVLDERPLGPFDVADIMLGALDAQLHLRGRAAGIEQGRGTAMSLRIGGIAAIVGVLCWMAGLALWSVRPAPLGPAGPPLLLIAGSVALLVAVAGLSAFQARVYPKLTWAAFVVTALGTLAFIGGFLGFTFAGGPNSDEAYWAIWALGGLTAIAGSTLFAVATYRTRALSRVAATLIGSGPLLLFTLRPGSQLLGAAVLFCFFLGWFVLGVQAIRLDRPVSASRPI